MRAYPDLGNGRFAVIADFEDPRHMELFRLSSAFPRAKIVLNQLRGRKDTGTGCLLFTANSDDDTVVISDDHAVNWHLKRDWRPFDLLLMSIHAPRPNLALRIIVSGGAPTDRLASGATIPLHMGWNTARLDLAELAGRVPLDDIREIRLSVSGASPAARLRIDDIIVTSLRKKLLGEPSGRSGGLYVEQIGRRWRIGAYRPDGAFELTFANGRIVAWHNLATDPNRLRNLVEGTKLGPTPVVVGSAGASEHDFLRFGSAVVSNARIVEMNAVRVVVTCDWRFVNDLAMTGEKLKQRPFQRWKYTIYSTGQVYVTVEATTETPQWTAGQLGLAVTLTPKPADTITVHMTDPPRGAGRNESPIYATARTSSSDAFLLFAPAATDNVVHMERASVESVGAPTLPDLVSIVAVGDRTDRTVESWTCHLMFGSAASVSAHEAQMRAEAYAHPKQPHLELGAWETGAADEASRDNGFDPSDGCYAITAPDDGPVRFVIDGTLRPYFSPCFRVADPARRDAWVYVNDEILEAVARDANGRLIFQQPNTIHDRATVEVLFRIRKPADGT